MKNLKKRLITGLSLGLSAITVGAVVSSCASSATQATDPNPASANSISTNPGDPLTPEQQDYQQKLAAEIKVQFDANAKLDYSVPADKANIDSQITQYKNNFDESSLKPIIDKINEYSKSEDINGINSYAKNTYDNFKQKNLLPNSEDVEKINSNNTGLELMPNISWYFISLEVLIFYSYQKLVINYLQLNIISNNFEANITEPLNFFKGVFYTLYSMTLPNILNKESSEFKAIEFYEPTLLEINNLISTSGIKSGE